MGLSGRDGGMVRARLEEGLGRVGTPEAVAPAPVPFAQRAAFLLLAGVLTAALTACGDYGGGGSGTASSSSG